MSKFFGMVIGNGLVANAFEIYRKMDDFVIFASGVSNSSNKEIEPFTREKKLLQDNIEKYPQAHLVYFSTCSIYDEQMANSMYVKHKLEMEKLIVQNCTTWNIFRISNLAGKTQNRHTILNFLYFHIKENKKFNIWNGAERNIIDVQDAFQICQSILNKKSESNKIFDIANIHNYKVGDIVAILEDIIGKNGDFEKIDKHSFPNIPMQNMESCIPYLNTIFTADYLSKVLYKYYQPQ